jgi:hypothetical protein
MLSHFLMLPLSALSVLVFMVVLVGGLIWLTPGPRLKLGNSLNELFDNGDQGECFTVAERNPA